MFYSNCSIWSFRACNTPVKTIIPVKNVREVIETRLKKREALRRKQPIWPPAIAQVLLYNIYPRGKRTRTAKALWSQAAFVGYSYSNSVDSLGKSKVWRGSWRNERLQISTRRNTMIWKKKDENRSRKILLHEMRRELIAVKDDFQLWSALDDLVQYTRKNYWVKNWPNTTS